MDSKVDPKKTKQSDKNEIELLKKTCEEYKQKYLRALADYQNLEKRILNEKEEIKKIANQNLILKILPFLDSLDKAEAFIKDDGLKLVKNNLLNLLKSEQVYELEVLGQEFNPYTSEVIELVEGEKENIVTEVIRKGYKFHYKVLRVAQVKVSKKKQL